MKGLPVHRVVYYQSYNQGVLQNLIMLNPTGNQQDCLGMTPLHILACSSVHDIKLYRVIIKNYPTNLIAEDRWGAVPLLYAFWGAAPSDIVQFLLDSYQSIYPDYVINWTMMVETMGRTDTPKECIENMLRMKQLHFPEQSIDWEYLLDKFSSPFDISFDGLLFQERMQFLIMCGLSDRVQALVFQVWRDNIMQMIMSSNFKWNRDNHIILYKIRAKVAHFEDKLLQLKVATTILELALWKLRLTENIRTETTDHCKKKIKIDESCIRQQCRVTCGADIVIGHVLLYLI
jgi:hypothetical protein